MNRVLKKFIRHITFLEHVLVKVTMSLNYLYVLIGNYVH
jgi:hypothetical protein